MRSVAFLVIKRLGLVVVLALSVAACGSSTEPASSDSAVEVDSSSSDGTTVVVLNQGGSMEGHTPRGFAGMGTGLFTGDNLNSGFPDGDGVQLFLTFEIPAGTPPATRLVLGSDSMSTKGTPFADLGQISVEPVTYDSFGRDLFDLPADADAVVCERPEQQSLRCDISDATVALSAAGAGRIQLRLKFEQVADNDGQPDLALFFLTDSNTNEPGIFFLELS